MIAHHPGAINAYPMIRLPLNPSLRKGREGIKEAPRLARLSAVAASGRTQTAVAIPVDGTLLVVAPDPNDDDNAAPVLTVVDAARIVTVCPDVLR